jgi:hypothetical protein
LNLRLSKSFRIYGQARVEAIGEIFNVFNAKNPALRSRRSACRRRARSRRASCSPWRTGDFQQPEQRLGQIGFRFSF